MLASLTTYCLPWVHTHKHGKVQLEWYHCHFNTQIKPCSHLSILSSLYAHAHTQEGSARMLPMSFQQTPTHLSLLSFLWMRTKSVLVYNTRYGSTKMHFQHTKHSPCFYPAFSLLYIHTHMHAVAYTHIRPGANRILSTCKSQSLLPSPSCIQSQLNKARFNKKNCPQGNTDMPCGIATHTSCGKICHLTQSTIQYTPANLLSFLGLSFPLTQ